VGEGNVGGKFVWGPPKNFPLTFEEKMRSKEGIFAEMTKMPLLEWLSSYFLTF
jgi:hypothetical protein